VARPIRGIGLGMRRQHMDDLVSAQRPIDFLEVLPENWLCYGGQRRKQLHACMDRFVCVSHSVSLSIGGTDPLDQELLDAIALFCERADAPFFSDHLCYSTVLGQPTHDLLPLPFSNEVARHIAARVAQAQAHVGRPLLLENATYYLPMPGAELDEAGFLGSVLVAADCGMLLDINNVYVNSRNHGYDPFAFIDQLPLERVQQLHLAGHTQRGEVIIDTHIGPIIDPVWALYRYTLRRAGRLIPTLIEWDQDIPALDVLLAEVDRARAAADRALASASASAFTPLAIAEESL